MNRWQKTWLMAILAVIITIAAILVSFAILAEQISKTHQAGKNQNQHGGNYDKP